MNKVNNLVDCVSHGKQFASPPENRQPIGVVVGCGHLLWACSVALLPLLLRIGSVFAVGTANLPLLLKIGSLLVVSSGVVGHPASPDNAQRLCLFAVDSGGGQLASPPENRQPIGGVVGVGSVFVFVVLCEFSNQRKPTQTAVTVACSGCSLFWLRTIATVYQSCGSVSTLWLPSTVYLSTMSTNWLVVAWFWCCYQPCFRVSPFWG